MHCVSHSVLESMCRLSAAKRHDASRVMLQRTTVLVRRKRGTAVSSITAEWTTILLCQVRGLSTLID